LEFSIAIGKVVRSSGDSASLFGYSQCASTLKLPSGAKR